MSLSATHWTIVQAAQGGDAEAVRALCLKYRPAVVAYLARQGLGDEAEDVANEALVALVSSALRRADPGAGRFRALVFAVARHLALRHRERAAARKRGAGRVVPLGDVDPAAATPDDDFDREWLAGLVQRALARLEREHPDHFTALSRFGLGGEPQAAIAAALGVSEGTIKKRVFRGKRELVAYLREEVWSYALSPGDYEAELGVLSRLLGGPPGGESDAEDE